MSTKNFVVKNGLTVGNASIDATTANLISGNANLGNLAIANFFQGNGYLLTGITGSNVTGQVANALVAGTVYTNAQPNITSVGTLSSLAVSGTSNLNQVSNVTILGGSSGQFLQTNGSGVLTWATVASNGISNGTSNIVIASSGGNIAMTVAGNANVLLVTGTGVNVAGTLNATGNANVGNLGTAGLITATGNVSGGNLTTGGLVSATGNVSGGNLTTAGALSVTGNANIGNIGTAQVLASANVTAPQLISNVSTGTAPLVVTSTTVVANLRAATSNVANTVNDAAQPNITSVGTLTSVAVTGNATAGNVYANSGTIGASLLTGTLTTAAQPNITSVGSLTSLTVTGNVAAGNLNTTGILSVSGTGVSSIAGNLNMNSKNIVSVADPVNAQDAATKNYVDTVVQGLHVHDSCYVATTGTLNAATGGTVSYNNGSSGVGATLTVSGGTYTTIDGLSIATVGTRVMVKNEANAVWNGIYTYTSSTVLTRATDFDTTAEAAGGDFFFITSGTVNADTGWVQTTDNPVIGTSNIVFTQFSGAGTYTAGTGLTLTGTVFSISNTAVTTGTYGNGDRVAQFTVNQQGQLTAASNVVIAANAANLTGTTLNSSIVTSSLTTVGTLGSLAVTGNATVGNLIGPVANGNSNVNIPAANGNVNISAAGTANVVVVTSTGANITGTVNASGNANVGNLGTGGLITATGNVSGGNLTTGGVLSVTGNANVGNLGTAGLIVATGNITGGNLMGPHANGNSNVNIPAAAGNVNISVNGTANVLVVTATGANITGTLNASGNANVGNLGTAGLITATGNVTGGNLTTGGVLSVTGNANVGNLGTAGLIVATGNITGGNLMGPLANGNSSVNIPAAAGNINLSVNGTSNVLVVTATGANIAGTLNATGNANVGNIGANNAVFTLVTGTLTTAAQPNITSVGTLTAVNSSGNVTAPNVVANTGAFYGNGGGLTNLPGGNVSGQVANALVAGTVYTAAQPNITSVGTLTSVAVTGNGTFGNVYANSGTIGASLLTGTLTTAAQPNITSTGTLTSLTVSGNIVTSGNLKIGSAGVGITSNRSNVSVTNTATVIDQFPPANWRTAKYVISASGTNGYQSVEALLVHDGTDAYVTIYGSICSNVSADIIDLSANINGVSGNVSVYATSNSASCVVNLVSSYIKT
jgi:hypothetical protein